MHNVRSLILSIATFTLTCSPLYSGGIILYEVGSNDVGLASAGFAARANDPSTAFTNPAGMSRLASRQVEFGAQPIYSHLHFDPNSETTTSGSKGNASLWIPSGGLFYVEPINECWSVGASFVGYFGSKMDFNNSWVGRYYLNETLLQGYSFIPAISCKLHEKFSIGVGVQTMYALFKQKSAINNSQDRLPDGSFKIYDDDFGFGCLLGVLFEPTPSTRFGIQYLSEVRLQFNCKPHLHNLGPTLKNALAANGISNGKIILDTVVPQSIMFSLFHAVTCSWALMANAGWQEWSNFQKASIVLNSASLQSLTAVPKYKNTWHAAIGTQYNLLDNLLVSLGFAYDSSAISTKNRTLDFPIGKQLRYGAGIKWDISNTLAVAANFTLMRQGNLSVDVERGSLVGRVSGAFKNTYAQFFDINVEWTF